MSYYIAKTVDQPFDAVVTELTARLKEHGFGLLTDIDVQSTLKSKIGAEIGKYRILDVRETCNRFLSEPFVPTQITGLNQDRAKHEKIVGDRQRTILLVQFPQVSEPFKGLSQLSFYCVPGANPAKCLLRVQRGL